MDSSNTSSYDDDEIICPLCCEPMDETDLTLFPCLCNYQVIDLFRLFKIDLCVVFEHTSRKQPSLPKL